jgi:hypothetical protein
VSATGVVLDERTGPDAGPGILRRWRTTPVDRTRRTDRLVTAAVAAVTAAVYLRSLLPGIGYSGDSAKFQMIGAVGGVPHATGYPLYVALIQAFHTLVPIGSSAWRVNLFSAVCGVAAVAVLYRLVRLLDVRPTVAAATALTFAFTTTFWTQSVVAEVYSLHVLFTVAVATCLVRWRLGWENYWLLAGLGLYALSFGHHLTTSLALPSVVWIVASDWRRALRLRNVAFAVGAALVGAAQYLYLLRMSAVGGYVEYHVDGLHDIADYVTGGPFKDEMFGFTVRELVTVRLPLIGDLVERDQRLLLVPAALGVVRALLWRNAARRAVVMYLLLLGASTAFYAMNYDVSDIFVFLLPLYLAAAVFIGIGLEGAVAWSQARRPDSRRLAAALAVAVVAVPVATFLIDHGRAGKRHTTADRERIERAIAVADHHAMLLTDNYEDSQYLWYYTVGEGLRDRDLVVSAQLPPAAVVTYFQGGHSKLTIDATFIEGPGPPRLYTATPHQAAALRTLGLEVTPVAESVWEITEGTVDDPDPAEVPREEPGDRQASSP